MTIAESILNVPNRRVGLLALLIVGLDQATKAGVQRFLEYGDRRVVVDGFFKLVHWGNTGAAWSMFADNNKLLAVVALAALVALFLSRRHFGGDTLLGQIALGVICGGIIGNLIDRLRMHYVIDFIYFYVQQRGGQEIGFPAFNVADSAICVGVGLIFINTWRTDNSSKPVESASSKT
jgi:signal peptidase II